MDNVATGAAQYLAGLTDVTALLGAFPANDPVGANASQPWVFTVGLQGEVPVTMEGSSKSAVVVCDVGSFSAGTPGSTAQYDRLSVEFWVDVARDASRNVTETSGQTMVRAKQLYDTVDSHLHRRTPGDNVVWGDLVTVGGYRLSAASFYAVPDGDGLLRGQAFYAITVSGHVGSTV